MPRPALWTPDQLDAIERKFPSHEVKSLVSEIRRLNFMVMAGHDFTANLPANFRDNLPSTPRILFDEFSRRLYEPR